MHNKSVFTTGEVADFLHIHQTTVIDWVDKGLLQSYKTPGGHRRIQRESLFKFLEEHNMPVPHILLKPSTTQIIDEAHRHVHEGFQIGPMSRPADATPVPKRAMFKDNSKRTRLGQRKV